MTGSLGRPPGLAPPPVPCGAPAARLGAYRQGNTGIEYVHTFSATRPGPHLMLNCLTHGNEPAGIDALGDFLDRGLRPARGTLTLSFANPAAHAPRPVRYLERDMNRLWSDTLLDGQDVSVEAARARALRPVLREVDYLIDLHSTAFSPDPFFVLPRLARSAAFARDLARFPGVPRRQLLLADEPREGPHLIEYRQLAWPGGHALGLIVECGTHFSAASTACAGQVCHAALCLLGMLPDADAAPNPTGAAPAPERYEVVTPCVARCADFVLAVPYTGFVAVSNGQVVAWDGDQPVRAPADLVVLPPRALHGPGIAFNWGRRID